MREIPLQSVPSQSTKISLYGKICQIFIYQKLENMFVDVTLDGVQIVTCVLALDAEPLIAQEYKNFPGNLIFIDTKGNSKPDYTGLNSRFALIYLTVEENALIQQ